MDRNRSAASPTRTVAELADVDDLRSVISSALAARPIERRALQRGVWSLVGLERSAGTPPGRVIVSLTELVDAANIAPEKSEALVARQVILWCVEAYFGHLDGDAGDPDALHAPGSPNALPSGAFAMSNESTVESGV